MKKDIWLKPGKQINSGAIVGGIGFVLYLACSALGWSGIALIVAIGRKKNEDLSSTFERLEKIWTEYQVYEKSE